MKIPRIKLPGKRALLRTKYILKQCAGRNVLHLGCSDAPYTEEKFKTGLLLHSRISRIAASIIGIDNDAESVSWLRAKGVDNIFACDAVHSDELISELGFKPDVIVAGEIVEHLLHPVDLLIQIQRIMERDTFIIISVPNAFHYRGIIHSMTGYEKTHPDHYAYYSYVTLRNLLGEAGLEIEEIIPYRTEKNSWGQKMTLIIEGPLLWLFPHLSPGYVLKAGKKKENV